LLRVRISLPVYSGTALSFFHSASSWNLAHAACRAASSGEHQQVGQVRQGGADHGLAEEDRRQPGPAENDQLPWLNISSFVRAARSLWLS
jgi:hypothetical protein